MVKKKTIIEKIWERHIVHEEEVCQIYYTRSTSHP